ncbi:hypothetical protein XO12_02300 [Marinitoga sp. 1154]|uniref:coiled-coil domain-containing protein n=1 Tax=Marinitoga sp. 1154 TaxID=1643335 RepID=UPI0015865D35|nr:hypothetical protein [Marinitoga sp. 1154]NUU98990.1 hypothetical protein [Marinitoga sp. 1154]
MKKIFEAVLGVIIVMVVFYLLFPTTAKSLYYTIIGKRNEFENMMKIQNAVKLAEAEIKKEENLYNQTKEKIIDLKLDKNKLEKELSDIKTKVEKYNDAIKKLANKYKEAVDKGLDTVIIGSSVYTLEQIRNEMVKLKNEIENKLNPLLETKKNTTKVMEESIKKLEIMLNNYNIKIEKDKAKVEEIKAKITQYGVSKKINDLYNEFYNTKSDTSINSILDTVDQELSKWDMMIKQTESNNIIDELNNENEHTDVENFVDSLLNTNN